VSLLFYLFFASALFCVRSVALMLFLTDVVYTKFFLVVFRRRSTQGLNLVRRRGLHQTARCYCLTSLPHFFLPFTHTRAHTHTYVHSHPANAEPTSSTMPSPPLRFSTTFASTSTSNQPSAIKCALRRLGA
jgi:hypothetical protein